MSVLEQKLKMIDKEASPRNLEEQHQSQRIDTCRQQQNSQDADGGSTYSAERKDGPPGSQEAIQQKSQAREIDADMEAYDAGLSEGANNGLGDLDKNKQFQQADATEIDAVLTGGGNQPTLINTDCYEVQVALREI